MRISILFIALFAVSIFVSDLRGDWNVDADWRSTCDGPDVTSSNADLATAVNQALALLDVAPQPYPSDCDPVYFKYVVSITDDQESSAQYRVTAVWRKRNDPRVVYPKPAVTIVASGRRNAINSALHALHTHSKPSKNPYADWCEHIISVEPHAAEQRRE